MGPVRAASVASDGRPGGGGGPLPPFPEVIRGEGPALLSAGACACHRRVSGSGSRPARTRLPDSPWFPTLTTALAALTLSVVFVVAAEGDASRLVQAGDVFTDPASAPPSLAIAPGTEGFDGQFYFRMAHDPFSAEDRVLGIRFDTPSFRAQRVVYPLLAWIFSGGGQARYIPWSLVLVNAGALTACAWFGAMLAKARGQHAAWGLLAAGYPGFIITLSLDLTEIVASALVLAGLWALSRQRYVVASAALSVATLTRETTAVVALGILAAGLMAMVNDRRDGRPPWPSLVPGVVAMTVLVAWQALLFRRYGTVPLSSSGTNNVTAPFAGFLSEAGGIFPPTSSQALFRLLSLGFLLAVALWAGISLRSSSAPLHEKVAWVGAALLPIFLSGVVWAGATGFLRATTELYLMSVLVVVGRREPLPVAVALPGAGMAGLSVVAQATKGM